MTRNVKRKFLNGISSQLRLNLFIFCQDPHSDAITTEKLLEAVRKTKLHLMEQTDNTVSSTLGNPTVNTVHPASAPVAVDPTLSAINHLTTMFTEHMQTTEAKFKEQEAQIDAIHAIQADNAVRARDSANWRESPSSRGRFTARGRDRARGRFASRQPGTTASFATRSREGIKCWNCGEKNHFARDCQVAPLNE